VNPEKKISKEKKRNGEPKTADFPIRGGDVGCEQNKVEGGPEGETKYHKPN